jgi:hypothetical protein
VNQQIVPRLVKPPYHCAALPQLGAGHPKGFFETGRELPWESHVYISVEYVEQRAQQLGWASPGEHARMGEALEEAQAQVELLKRELDSKQSVIDAIDMMESDAAFRRRKRPGPKPREKATA